MDESVQAVLRFAASKFVRLVVRRFRRRIRRSALLRSYLRPYVLAYGVYRFFVKSRSQSYRIDLKRGETVQIERR